MKATAKPAAAVDLSHQTLAVRPETPLLAVRRSLPALPVSAVGLDDPDGTYGEPKGAMLLLFYAVQLSDSRKMKGIKSNRTEMPPPLPTVAGSANHRSNGSTGN